MVFNFRSLTEDLNKNSQHFTANQSHWVKETQRHEPSFLPSRCLVPLLRHQTNPCVDCWPRNPFAYQLITKMPLNTSRTTELSLENISIPLKLLPLKAWFVSRKLVSGKLFSKLSCVCLSLGKLVNGKHFLVNGKHFPVNGKHFPVNFSQKKKLTWFSGKCFPFNCVCFPESGFRESTFQTFLCLFASRKVGQWKTLSSKRKIWLGLQESVFLKNLGENTFRKLWKI